MLIDCPPSLGRLTIDALTAASQLIVVTEPSFLALQGIKELLDTYDLVREHYNQRLELAGVIVNLDLGELLALIQAAAAQDPARAQVKALPGRGETGRKVAELLTRRMSQAGPAAAATHDAA